MLPPVFQTLKASTAVKAIVGQNPPRIYRHGSAPQRPDGLPLNEPYITWFLAAGSPENTLSELPACDHLVVQVDCWHQTDSGVEALAIAVRDAIEPYALKTGDVADGRETETKLYRIGQQFDWFVDR